MMTGVRYRHFNPHHFVTDYSVNLVADMDPNAYVKSYIRFFAIEHGDHMLDTKTPPSTIHSQTLLLLHKYCPSTIRSKRKK